MNASPKFLGLRGIRLKVAMIILVVAPSFLLFGYNNGSTGGIGTLPSFLKQFPRMNTVTTTGALKTYNARVKGVVTGSYDLGAVIGSLSCIAWSDKIGRLRTILVGLILAIISLAIESSAFSLAQFTVGRILVGMSIGIISASIPVWQAECASTVHRGVFVIMEGLFISGGITLSEWVAYGISFDTTSSAAWRVPLVFPAVFAVFVIPMLHFMPESPRWLVRQGRLDEAREVLAALRDESLFASSITAEFNAIQQSLAHSTGKLSHLKKNGDQRFLHRTVLAACGQMFQQMCGISALVFYTSTIFADLGFKGTKPRLLGACLTTFQTVCSIIPLFTIDRFGRRKLLMFSAAGLSICMAVIAGTSGKSNTLAKVAVVFVFLYDFFYPIGFLGLTFLYASEISPLQVRVPITAIANATQWMFQFVVANITPPGTTNLGNRYWIIFAVLNASFVPLVYFFFPETNGRDLEEIDDIFSQSKSIFDPVRIAKSLPKLHRKGDSESSSASVMPTSSAGASDGAMEEVSMVETEDDQKGMIIKERSDS